ncbi:MAG: efflux RND transporter periplasmic adaptor subunit [Rhizomicrobium sp.]
MNRDSERGRPRQPRNHGWLRLPAAPAIAVATAFLLCGCSRPANPPQRTSPVSGAAQSGATVDLSPDQLHTIKIESVGTYRFPVEKEAVGTVSFAEDPAIVQAESTLIGAAATFVLTSKELQRAKDLYRTKGVSQRELEQATSDQQTAAAAYRAARDAVRALGETDAAIDRMVAAGRIDSAPVGRSPSKWVAADVVESDSALVQTGQKVEVKVLAFPGRVFDGKVSKIYTTVDPNTHRMLIRCAIADPNDELRVGMLANVTIQIQNPVESIAIRDNGVVREGDGTMTAWVTTDRHRFVQRIVQTGLHEDGQMQIRHGLQRGELVVTDGAIFLDNMLQAPPSD